MAPKRKKGQPGLGPLYLIVAGILLVTGVLIWQAAKLTQSPPALSPTSPLTSSLPYPNVERVTVADARAALDNNQAVFVDVRDEASFKSGHVPGAVNIYLVDFDSRYTELSKDDSIILYCT